MSVVSQHVPRPGSSPSRKYAPTPCSGSATSKYQLSFQSGSSAGGCGASSAGSGVRGSGGAGGGGGARARGGGAGGGGGGEGAPDKVAPPPGRLADNHRR